jgi:NADH:ubiquinone oxidoreductase subunit 5 (subunit L)/multisubunit Na+/H+ antiporter MnhA subunit
MGDFSQDLRQGKFMSLRRVQLIVIFFSIWVLAIVLPTLRFAPANWALLQMDRIQEHASPGMQVLVEIIGICLIFSMAILGVLLIVFIGIPLVVDIWRKVRKKQEDDFIIYREHPPVTWRVYAVIVLFVVGFGGLIWLTWRHADVLDDLMGTQRSAETAQVQGQRHPSPKISSPETKRPEIRTVSSLQWRAPLILVLLIASGMIVWLIFKPKPSKEGHETPQVIQIVANAVEELEKGGELSDIVLRCYRDMCKILGQKVTMSRDLTAREITRALLHAGVQEKEVARLTDLFERVRYGRHITGPGEQAEAVTLLKTVEEKYARPLNET